MPFIPLEVYTNNPSTTVSSGGTSAPAPGTVETWTVGSSSSFPAVELGATQFHVADPALPSEMITVQNVSGTTWTVQRGAESSSPVAHAAGFTVVQVVTAGALANLAYPAWQFPVQQYGAQGDGKIGTGGTGTSGTNTFTDSGASFVNATAPQGDIGKYIIINQGTGSATSATNPFCGTITAVNSATSVTLSANLGANCSAAPYVYGTDDAAAINAAVTAAANWAVTTGNYKCQVMFEPQLYMLGALTQSTTFSWAPFNSGSYTYNTHITVPFAGQFARKMIIDFVGVGDASEPDFWGSSVPSVQGTCLVSAVFPPNQPDATFGQMSVVGTPAAQTGIGNGGISGGSFANVLINVTGIAVVMPFNGQQFGYDFRFAAQANVDYSAALAFAPVNFASQTVGGTWLRQTNLPSNNVGTGLAMPIGNNNDNDNIGLFSAEGLAIGVTFSEHLTAQRLGFLYCNIAMKLDWTQGQIVHGGSIAYLSIEGCGTGIASFAGTGSQFPLFVGNADFEAMVTWYINDSSNNLTGTMYWADLGQWSPAAIGVNGAAHYNIVNTRIYPGVWAANASLNIPAPPSAPSSGTAQQNTPYRTVTVYATASTSITAFAVGPTSGTLVSVTVSAGANVAVPVRVPPGWWYSVTYTGTLTTTWVLD